MLFFRPCTCASAQISSATSTSSQPGTRPPLHLQNHQQQTQVVANVKISFQTLVEEILNSETIDKKISSDLKGIKTMCYVNYTNKS